MKYSIYEYRTLYDALPTETKVIPSTEKTLFGQTHLFSTSYRIEYNPPNWIKKIISDTIRYDDILTSIYNAKNGRETNIAIKVLELYTLRHNPVTAEVRGLFL